MKIKIAKTAGFCMGVRRAVNLVLDRVHADKAPIYSLGSLIHNPQVVEFLRAQGVRDVSDINDLKKSDMVVIPSHGIPPELRDSLREKAVDFCDATCPRVAKVHGIIKKYLADGFLIVILGDPGHAEVLALLGEARGEASVIQGPEQAANLPDADKVLLVAQTTQSRETFDAVAEAVRKRYAGLDNEKLRIEDTICDSTRRRQEEVRKLAHEVDVMVVVGGKASANSGRLAKISEEEGIPAFFVENEKELDWENLKHYKVIGLTAGASTPNWMIRRVYEELSNKKWENRSRPLRWLYYWLRSLVVSNLYISLGAASLCLSSGIMQGSMPRLHNLAVSFLYVFTMHTFNVLVNRDAVSLNEPMRSRAFESHRATWFILSIFSLLAAFGICLSIGLWSFIIFSLASIPGLMYQFQIIKGSRSRLLPYRSLADIPGSKDIFSALGWSLVCVVLPLLDTAVAPPRNLASFWPAAAAFLYVLILVFARSVIQGFRDLQGDRMIGRETLPIVLGDRRTRLLLYAVILVLGMLFCLLFIFGIMPSIALWMLLPVAYAWLCISLFTRRTIVQGLRAESLVDLTFLLAGIVATAYKFAGA